MARNSPSPNGGIWVSFRATASPCVETTNRRSGSQAWRCEYAILPATRRKSGCASRIITCVDLGTSTHKDNHHIDAAFLRGQVQRCGPAAPFPISRRTLVQEKLDDVRMAVKRG